MVLRALLLHYRHHPMQALFLLTGIVVANVLLVGTQLINAQARASYAQGERILGAGPAGRIVPAGDGPYLDERLFVELRLQGFDAVAPALRWVGRSAEGRRLELYGIDALSMPRSAPARGGGGPGGASADIGDGGFGEFAFPPYRVLAAPALLEQLGVRAGARLRLANGAVLPPVQATRSGELGQRMLIDLGALQALSGSPGRLSSLLVFERDPTRLADLLRALPPEVVYRAGSDTPDPAQMTRSFHLNLAAMGLLACVVGLFLTYNALAFSFTDRRELIRRLRLAGVARGELARALLFEVAVFLAIGTLVGFWLGGLLAARLLPGVVQTLAQLYDVYVAYPGSLLPQGYWLPLATTCGAAFVCAAFPLREALRGPLLERAAGGWGQRAVRRRDRLLLVAGVSLLIAAALVAQSARTTGLALGGMACLLLGGALCLPAALRWLLGRLTGLVPPRAPRLGWLLADSRWLLGPASLALMAMTLALVANSGLNSMIGSFRAATDDWLQQRLVAQLYLRDGRYWAGGRVAALQDWLAAAEPRAALTARYSTEVDVPRPRGGVARVEVIDLAANQPFRDSVQLLRAVAGAEARLHAGDGIFVSERAWRLDGWDTDQRVTLCPAQPALPVLGVYHDYGNPHSQWIVAPHLLRGCWPDAPPSGVAVHGPSAIDWPALRTAILEHFDLRDDAVIDQRQLRAVGLAVFDRTFGVTRALNLLTLLVAGVGIFCSVSAIHHHRVGQQALLATLGLSRGERGALLLLQWGLLGLLCMLLVGPLGTALAWYLAAVVTPAAFGWSFPLRIELAPLVTLALIACAALLLAGLVPSLRLLRVSPAAMLREQVA